MQSVNPQRYLVSRGPLEDRGGLMHKPTGVSHKPHLGPDSLAKVGPGTFTNDSGSTNVHKSVKVSSYDRCDRFVGHFVWILCSATKQQI